MAAREVFSAIVYVLRTGCQWKALPASTAVPVPCTPTSSAGMKPVFSETWQSGLAEYDGMHGIQWQWQIADGAMSKAPLATECAGRNQPTGEKKDASAACWSTAWTPAIDRRQRSQRPRLEVAG